MPDRVKEKLVALLENAFDRFIDDPYYIPNEENFADDLIANGVTVQQWIPASEPPTASGEYNVMIQGASVATTLTYRLSQNEWVDEDSNFYNVICWMPLPQPPKGEISHKNEKDNMEKEKNYE